MLKRVAKYLAAAAVALFAIEILLRVVFAIKIGPSILLLGLTEERVIADGYTKYKPFQKRYDTNPDTGMKFAISINSRGFRGEEYQTKKKEGVTRVVTLGASSTFGFRDRDDETYPFLLGQVLNESCGEGTFEVINLGIPHLESNHILALFRKEALELEPDIVTFYEGINDSASAGVSSVAAVREMKEKGKQWPTVARWYRNLRDHTLLIGLASKLIQTSAESTSRTATEFKEHMRLKRDRFLNNINQIKRDCEQRGIHFIVANQQATSLSFSREELRDLSYAAELELLHKKREREPLTDNELYLLIHSGLMQSLEEWAVASGVPFVNVIEELDRERDSLVSWVHLNARGNERLARAFALPIMERACSAKPDGTRNSRG